MKSKPFTMVVTSILLAIWAPIAVSRLFSPKVMIPNTIPKMNIYELPIYYGESRYNNNWQITCPGHLSGFGLPGEAAPTAIGAHNYQLFSQLPSLKAGDKFIVETSVDVYVYTVVKTEVYNHLTDNWSNLSYNSKDPYDMELMTCYPIEAVVTKDTYIVTAKLQKGTEFTAAQQ